MHPLCHTQVIYTQYVLDILGGSLPDCWENLSKMQV